MPSWERLLERALAILDRAERSTGVSFDWTFGGGTALMVVFDHRTSKDIDIFVPDPQMLPYLSPRLSDDPATPSYVESGACVKLVYPEGEIDFIAARPVTALPTLPHRVGDRVIPMEHPVEIALKKLRYRGRDLKPRDIFDIAVVAAAYDSLLVQEMARHVAERRASLLERLHTLRPSYLAAALAELDVRPAGRPAVEACSAVVAGLVEALPRTDATEPH